MAITSIEHLEDRVRVHHLFPQPDGVADNGVLEIPYSSIPALPILPEREVVERESYLYLKLMKQSS